MKFESIGDLKIPKIGFGTWKIGGGSAADPKKDSVSRAALRSAVEIGYTHFDTAEMYAGGHSEELIGAVVREMRLPREGLFITTKVLPSHLKFDAVLRACENSLRRLQMDYVDMYLIHWPQAGMKLEETFRALNQLVREGKVRHLGVSNFDVRLLKRAQDLASGPLLSNQVPFSVNDRSYVKNGMLEYCQSNDILLTAYSPLDEGHMRASKSLRAIAAARGVSPELLALAWLVAQPRVITIPMSANPTHIRENFEAANIELSSEEMRKLSDG